MKYFTRNEIYFHCGVCITHTYIVTRLSLVILLHRSPHYTTNYNKKGQEHEESIFKTTTKHENEQKSLGAVALTAGIIGTTLIPQNAYAHGFVEKPSSRSALCSPTYGALNVNCGSVMYEPQSLEAPKGSRNRPS